MLCSLPSTAFLPQNSHGSLGCLIFHDVDLIPLDARNIYGCVTGPRALHLSAHLENFRFNLPYHDLFGGAVAVEEAIFEDINGFSNQFYGKKKYSLEGIFFYINQYIINVPSPHMLT